MAIWHGYFGIENLNLNVWERQTLVNALRELGAASDPQPARLCHWRTRLDGDGAIFEAAFSEDGLTIGKWKNRLGSIFTVNPATINHAAVTRHFAGGDTPVVTFSKGGTDYLRVALFGGVGTAWNESGDECRGYLLANLADWELPLDELQEDGVVTRLVRRVRELPGRARAILSRRGR